MLITEAIKHLLYSCSNGTDKCRGQEDAHAGLVALNAFLLLLELRSLPRQAQGFHSHVLLELHHVAQRLTTAVLSFPQHRRRLSHRQLQHSNSNNWLKKRWNGGAQLTEG